MKAFMKLAVCGFIALAVQSQAFAQAAQAQLEKLATTRMGQQFLQQTLGVSSMTAADLNAAMAKLSGAEQAALLSLVNKFNSGYVAGNSIQAKSQNEQLAKSIFAPKGQMIQLAAVVKDTTTRSAVDEALNGQTCGINDKDEEIARRLTERFQKSGIRVYPSYDDILSARQAGYVTLGSCAAGKNLEKMGVQAQVNAIEMQVCEFKAGAKNLPQAEREKVGAECLAAALANDEVTDPSTGRVVKASDGTMTPTRLQEYIQSRLHLAKECNL